MRFHTIHFSGMSLSSTFVRIYVLQNNKKKKADISVRISKRVNNVFGKLRSYDEYDNVTVRCKRNTNVFVRRYFLR